MVREPLRFWVIFLSVGMFSITAFATLEQGNCYDNSLGSGVPGYTYTALIKVPVRSERECDALQDQIQSSLTETFDARFSFLRPSLGCETNDVGEVIATDFSFLIEPWNKSNVGAFRKALASVQKTEIAGVSVQFQQVEKILSQNSVSLFKELKDSDMGHDRGVRLVASRCIYNKQYAEKTYTSFIEWCQAPKDDKAKLRDSDFAQTLALLVERLDSAELTKVKASLPETATLSFEYGFKLQLKGGEVLPGSFGRFAARDCRLLTCKP